MSTPLDSLLSRPGLIWRPGERRAPATTGLPTGFAPLDAVLRESGWPRGALVELLAGRPGAGELRLLLPALAALTARGLYQLWIDPPFSLFAPALVRHGLDLARLVVVRPANHREWLWAAEQSLRSPGCGAVVCWMGNHKSRYAELRKLQVASAERGCTGFLFGPPRVADAASPAALRLQLAASPDGLAIDVLKQRGAAAGQRIVLETPRALRKQVPLRERPAVVSAPRRRLRLPQLRPIVPGAVQQEVWQ